MECTWAFGYSSTGRPYVAAEVMYGSLLAKFSPCVGRSESSWVRASSVITLQFRICLLISVVLPSK